MHTFPGITLLGQPEKRGVYDQQEIVTLLTQYYELLAKMRYFPASYIKYAPHDPPIDVDLAKSFDLEPQVIELLQALPYVEGYSNEDEFILGGSFANMRDLEVLMQSRDPGFASPEDGFDDENGEYMRPWELCINGCGNHGAMMFLDTRNGHITMEGQDSGRSEDPGAYNLHRGLQSRNRNSHDHLPSRHARELFEDFTNRLLKLQWIPSSEDRRVTKISDSSSEPTAGPITSTTPASTLPTPASANVILLNIILEEGRKLVIDANEMLEQAIADHGYWKGERAEMVKAWKKHFENGIEREEGNLDWWRGEGKAYCEEEEIEKTREMIRVLKGRLANVEEEPISVEEVIRSLSK
ncbi:hypothetical protein BPOR_0855g00020 [Botrytis porri]|uniref:Uncharacterized protein n=2 Tax=Botrytis porri TaxID=87229 RepID=A0A4Z1K8B7_9HELO|nr:hypothetical protein BPOR_0855g00020 [Botrytis porri]